MLNTYSFGFIPSRDVQILHLDSVTDDDVKQNPNAYTKRALKNVKYTDNSIKKGCQNI